jgi:Holliday junction resolvasome RuvABC endonuclease subunit
MTIYMDPSARACGMITFNENEEIVSTCVYDFIKGFKGTMPETSRLIASGMLIMLNDECKDHKIDKIVVELPVGSQNARAAWYLATVQTTIQCFSLLSGINYTGIKENQVKKVVHGRSKKVDKKDTIKFVFDKLPEFSYILRGNQVTQQALADTLAVWYAHKELTCRAKEEKVEDVSGE